MLGNKHMGFDTCFCLLLCLKYSVKIFKVLVFYFDVFFALGLKTSRYQKMTVSIYILLRNLKFFL